MKMESVMNKFPEDVIIQILLRLPVKSLLGFRSVCKAWSTLIKSANFIAMHFNYPSNENDHHVLIKRCLQDGVTNVLSIHSSTESLSTISPDLQIPHLDHQHIQLFGPCNGLVCITDFKVIVLCNPATKEFTLLPARPFRWPPDIYSSCIVVGFGFDAYTNHYKVITIVNAISDNFYIFQADVYRCSTNSWRDIDYSLPLVVYKDCFDLYFHGATHFYGSRECVQKILSFCITTEVFQEFNFPEGCPANDGKYKSLTVLNESLSMLSYTDPWDQIDNMFIDVWVMREYGVSESWTKPFTIGPLSEISHPITSWKNSAILVERTNGQLISCAIDTQEVKEFDIFGFPSTLRALNYKESLVSVRLGSWSTFK